MEKSILDLCRELPASEPEIRERAEEFNPAVWLAIAADMYTAQGMPDYLNSIADAKAATDATIARGFKFELARLNSLWIAEHYRRVTPLQVIYFVTSASTEELARSACALLAAEVMKGGK